MRALRRSVVAWVIAGLIGVCVLLVGEGAQRDFCNRGPLLAARYHLRNRTTHFFQRSTGTGHGKAVSPWGPRGPVRPSVPNQRGSAATG